MSRKNAIKAVRRVSIDAATINALTYTVINDEGLPYACNIVRIVNRSKTDITISFDGVTAHDYLLADGEMQLPAPFGDEQSGFQRFAKAYVMGTPGVGRIYAIGYYQEV